jgi:hypothetical protein
MSKQPRLELTWIGKDQRPRLEPRILLEDPARSYHAAHRVGDADLFDNRLFFADNLLALKALEQEFTGKIKCVYIDPPYNTGAAFAHYDDGIEHSLCLSLIRDRLELLRSLLAPNGSRWINLDDIEGHYLKVLCDEVFGRGNFVANIVWQKRTSRENRAAIGSSHDDLEIKWFKPAPTQFKIFYSGERRYEPDFVVETAKHKDLCEPKRASEMSDKEVQEKARAAADWCRHATTHELENGGKPWTYLLIPHDVIDESATLKSLAARYGIQREEMQERE